MQIIFAEIFVPQDFTIRLPLGLVDPQTRVAYAFPPNVQGIINPKPLELGG